MLTSSKIYKPYKLQFQLIILMPINAIVNAVIFTTIYAIAINSKQILKNVAIKR